MHRSVSYFFLSHFLYILYRYFETFSNYGLWERRRKRNCSSWDARSKFDKIFQISSRVQLQKNLILKVKFPAGTPQLQVAAPFRRTDAALSQLPSTAPSQGAAAAPSQLPTGKNLTADGRRRRTTTTNICSIR